MIVEEKGTSAGRKNEGAKRNDQYEEN